MKLESELELQPLKVWDSSVPDAELCSQSWAQTTPTVFVFFCQEPNVVCQEHLMLTRKTIDFTSCCGATDRFLCSISTLKCLMGRGLDQFLRTQEGKGGSQALCQNVMWTLTVWKHGRHKVKLVYLYCPLSEEWSIAEWCIGVYSVSLTDTCL